MKKGKRLILSSHHFPAKDTAVPWADVWANTTVKPGRRKRYLAPTLVATKDLETEEKILAELKKAPDPEHIAVRTSFAQGTTHFIGEGPEDMATVYTSEPEITREIAEELCLIYAQSLGIPATRVKWKRSKLFTRPV